MPIKIDKAYKILATQEGISNKKAKELIDLGVVFYSGKRVRIARAEFNVKTIFKINEVDDVKIIYEDNVIVAIDKPSMVNSSSLIEPNSDIKLINRLDKGTSGLILLSLNDEFRQKAVVEYANKRVYKEYIAIVSGVIAEEITINTPIETIKGNSAKSKISYRGKEALTKVEPMMIKGKFSMVKIIIETGRTHQIRVHLSSIGSPVLGDELYGGKPFKRVMLHSYLCKIFEYKFKSPIPNIFNTFMQS